MTDPLIPPWEMCKVCGGDHWTNQHAEIRPDRPDPRIKPSEWYDGYAAAILASLDGAGWTLAFIEDLQHDMKMAAGAATEISRLHRIEKVATDISRRTYVDDGVVAHVPFYKLYALRQALFGSDEEIVAALDRLER